MTDREKVIAIAKACGWPVFDRNVRDEDKPGADSGPVPCIAENRHGYLFALLEHGKWITFKPFESMDAAFAMQAAIPALGAAIRRKYTQALNRIAWHPEATGMGRDWAMINATARQRMDAAIQALELDR